MNKLLKEIKDFERKNKKIEEVPEQLINFEEWWLLRYSSFKMNPYLKDVLRADMKGRGLGVKNTLKQWDDAAKLFGLVF
jgi:hypothetical protein